MQDDEPNLDLRKFYSHLHVHSLVLTEDIFPVLQAESGVDLRFLVLLILDKFASFLQCSVMPDYEMALPASDEFPGLVTLVYYWRLSALNAAERLAHVLKCLDFNLKERRDETILLLRRSVNRLQSQFSEPSTYQEEYRAPRKKRKATSSVHRAANTVFQVLSASSRACQTSHKHEYTARLRLKTYRKRLDGQYAFDAFVNLSVAHQFWQETQIQAILNKQHEPRHNPRSVRFAEQRDNRKGRPRMHLERLCEQVEKTKSKPWMRLNLAVEDGKLWKDVSSKSEFPISRSDPPLTLKDIITSRPASLTEKVKRVLAVLLASSVLHLHGTPWMRHIHFNAANIMFFRTSTAVPLKPYIHVELIDSDTNAGDISEAKDDIDPDDLPIHPFPDIVMLAIMLMELYMVQPIQSLSEQADIELDDWNDIDDNMKYSIAVAVFERFKGDFTENFREAVDRCLDQNMGFDQNDEELDEEGLKRLIYEEIVGPLEDELDQGFGSIIPIDNLDEVAQTLDLNNCGQKKKLSQGGDAMSTGTPFEHISISHSPRPKTLKSTYSSSSDYFMFKTALENVKLSQNPDHSPLSVYEKLYKSQSVPSPLNFVASLSHESYTVGWICALPEEMAVAQAMLDDIHTPLSQNSSDKNNYTLGRMGTHNVVIACLPAKVIGTVAAARVSNHMLYTFKHLKFGLLVGIGGGVPGAKDIRLGDVVVGEPCESSGGVIQYDFGKTIEGGTFSHKGSLNRPPDVLLAAVSRLKADHYRGEPKFESYIKEMVMRNPRLIPKFSHPGMEHEFLYESDYEHCPCSEEGSCGQCDSTKLVKRSPREQHLPHVHYGLIASGNQVMRHGKTRDRLGKELGVLCIEMEAAGMVDAFPCLVIRGICDYSDSHKNKRWQGYAASTAAAYAKELLSVISA